MKKKLSYRDKLLELAYIYSVKEIQDYTKNIRKCEGENILIFKKIIKKSKNDMFCQLLNEKICKQVNIKDKKLYIINYDI